MNKKQWESMSNKEKYKLLSTGNLLIRKQGAMRADAKVNSDDGFVTVWQGSVDGIVVSNWCETQKEAVEESIENIEAWALEDNNNEPSN